MDENDEAMIDLQEQELMEYVMMLSQMEAEGGDGGVPSSEPEKEEAVPQLKSEYSEEAKEEICVTQIDQEEEWLKEAIARSLNESASASASDPPVAPQTSTQDYGYSEKDAKKQAAATPEVNEYGTPGQSQQQHFPESSSPSALKPPPTQQIAPTSAMEPPRLGAPKSSIAPPFGQSRPRQRRGLAARKAQADTAEPVSATRGLSKNMSEPGAVEPGAVRPSDAAEVPSGLRRGSRQQVVNKLSSQALDKISDVQREHLRMSKTLSVRNLSIIEDVNDDQDANDSDNVEDETISRSSEKEGAHESSTPNTEISPPIEPSTPGVVQVSSTPGVVQVSNRAQSAREQRLARKMQQINEQAAQRSEAAKEKAPPKAASSSSSLEPGSVTSQTINAAPKPVPSPQIRTPSATISSVAPGFTAVSNKATSAREQRFARKMQQVNQTVNQQAAQISAAQKSPITNAGAVSSSLEPGGAITSVSSHNQTTPSSASPGFTSVSNAAPKSAREQRLARKMQQVNQTVNQQAAQISAQRSGSAITGEPGPPTTSASVLPQPRTTSIAPNSITPGFAAASNPQSVREQRAARKMREANQLASSQMSTIPKGAPSGPMVQTAPMAKPAPMSTITSSSAPAPGDGMIQGFASAGTRMPQPGDRLMPRTRRRAGMGSPQPGDQIGSAAAGTMGSGLASSGIAAMPNTQQTAPMGPSEPEVGREPTTNKGNFKRLGGDDGFRPGAFQVTGRAVGDFPEWGRQGGRPRPPAPSNSNQDRTPRTPDLGNAGADNIEDDDDGETEALVSAIPVNEAEVVVYAEVVTPEAPTSKPDDDEVSRTDSDKMSDRDANISNEIGANGGKNKNAFSSFMSSVLRQRTDPVKRNKPQKQSKSVCAGPADMDPSARTHISKAIENGLINVFIKGINKGELGDLYYAGKGPNSSEDIAIKIITNRPRTQHKSIMMTMHDEEEREMAAKKEYDNLERAAHAGVKVPNPIELKSNIIFMSFIGDSEGSAPKLRELDIRRGNKRWKQLYEQILEAMRSLYCNANLVHGNMSEYNILVVPDSTKQSHSGFEVVIIDFARSVDSNHPKAMDLLGQDLNRIRTFFVKKAGVNVLTVEESFAFILAGARGVGP